MELISGYYEDAENRTYKVTEDCIYLYDGSNFKPMLSCQEFVLQFCNNLLVKKNIVELTVLGGDIILIYHDMDCPSTDGHMVDALRYSFSNFEAVVKQDVGFSDDCFMGYDERIELPMTPDQEIDYLESELETLHYDKAEIIDKLNRIENDIKTIESQLFKLRWELA